MYKIIFVNKQVLKFSNNSKFPPKKLPRHRPTQQTSHSHAIFKIPSTSTATKSGRKLQDYESPKVACAQEPRIWIMPSGTEESTLTAYRSGPCGKSRGMPGMLILNSTWPFPGECAMSVRGRANARERHMDGVTRTPSEGVDRASPRQHPTAESRFPAEGKTERHFHANQRTRHFFTQSAHARKKRTPLRRRARVRIPGPVTFWISSTIDFPPFIPNICNRS